MGFSCSSENSRRIRAAGRARARARPRRFRPLDDGRLRGTLNRRRSRDKIAHFESPCSPLPRPPRIFSFVPRASFSSFRPYRFVEYIEAGAGRGAITITGGDAQVSVDRKPGWLQRDTTISPEGKSCCWGASAREIFIPREEGGRPAFRRLRSVCCRRIYSDPVRGIFPRGVASARGEGSG